MGMEEIESLIDLGEKKGLVEFEVEKARVRVRIRYQQEPSFMNYAPPSGNAPVPGSEAGPMIREGNNPAPSATPAELEDASVSMVKSPIVGTFYASPDLNSAPYVTVGQKVQVGQVLCIVEAMKLMNEIESEVAGEIIKILVENAQPVEYGEALFAIRTEP